VASYGLTPFARSQLLAIHDWGDRKFGRAQADAYYAGMRHVFELLAHFPGIGRSAEKFQPGLQRHRYKSHVIFYSQEGDHILIRFIYHKAQNFRPELFG
jgi:toxin ParE1/3/4